LPSDEPVRPADDITLARGGAAPMSPRLARGWKLIAWAILAPGLAALLVRAFVGDVYYVDSRSMAPTLHGGANDGEYVFVQFDRSKELERFDVVVLQRPGESEPLVKRVAGLGGETVQVAAGDLVVQGKLLPPDAPRPPRVLLFDSAYEDLEPYFSVARHSSRWRRTERGWALDTDRGVSLAEWIPRALDDYYDLAGKRVNGRRNVQDLALDVELRIDGAWAALRLRLTEEGDRFDVVIEPGAARGRAQARFERRAAPRFGAEVLASGEIEFDASAPQRVVFSNVDNTLRLDIASTRGALTHSYAENTPMWGVGDGFQHQLPRAAFGGDGLAAEFTRVRLWRDVFWVDLGRHGVDQPLVLAPAELFVLGDNSGESLDSREWGPALTSWVLGRPRAVVWPPSSWRWLTGANAAAR
jgi:signal peptidase I